MKRIIKSGMLGILVCAAGCTTVKRYSSAKYKGEDNTLVSMYLTSAKIEADEKDPVYKDLWGLSDHGQQALINDLNARLTDMDKFTKALNGQYMKKDDGTAGIDLTSKNLKMIFTISKKRAYETLGADGSKFSPADRIEYLKYNLEIPNEVPLTFVKWNQYTTQYGTVSIAAMTFSQNLSATAGYGSSGTSSNETKNGTSDDQLTDALKSSTTTPSIGVSGSVGKTESQNIQYRYIQLNGSMNDKHLYMEEEGMREIDLTGNVTADIALKFDETLEYIYKTASLKTDAGLYNKPEDVKVSVIPIKLPNMSNAPDKITGTLNVEYVYRHVKSGAETFYEYDDDVEYYKGTESKPVTIFKKADYLPKLFYIGRLVPQQNQPAQKTMLVVKEGPNFQPLRFETLQEARDFFSWAENFPCLPANINAPIKWGPYELFVTSNNAGATAATRKFINDNFNYFSVLDYYQ